MNNKGPYANYDLQSDVLYIALREGEEEGYVEVVPGVNVELDLRGEVIGIEILRASEFLRPVAVPLLQRMGAADIRVAKA